MSAHEEAQSMNANAIIFETLNRSIRSMRLIQSDAWFTYAHAVRTGADAHKLNEHYLLITEILSELGAQRAAVRAALDEDLRIAAKAANDAYLAACVTYWASKPTELDENCPLRQRCNELERVMLAAYNALHNLAH